MANTFKSSPVAAVGTSATTIYTVPASTQAVILGVTAANILGSTINVTVTLVKSGVTTYNIVKNAPILTGSSLEVIGGGSKFVMEATDVIKITSDTAASVDAIVSYLEIT